MGRAGPGKGKNARIYSRRRKGVSRVQQKGKKCWVTGQVLNRTDEVLVPGEEDRKSKTSPTSNTGGGNSTWINKKKTKKHGQGRPAEGGAGEARAS